MITDSLSERSKKEWPKIYERLTGKKWDNPTKGPIKCETKIESLEEIINETDR
jgi:hypothetical protein